MYCLITWCNNNQGFLSAVLTIVSLSISVLALHFSRRTEKKQYVNALYDKRLAVSKSIDELMEYITYLELYKTQLCDDNLQDKKRAIDMIKPNEINMEWIYEFRKAKFVVGKSKMICVNNISDWVSALLRNYRIFKESVQQNYSEREDIQNVFANIEDIKDNVQDLRDKIEKDLYL